MKNANSTLARIYEIDNELSSLEREREVLRGLLIAEGKARLVTDEYEATVIAAERVTAKPRADIERIIGDKKISCRLFRKVGYIRVSVRKR